VSSGRRSRRPRAVVLLAALPCLLSLLGCTRAVDGVPTAGPVPSSPGSPEELEELIVTDVPSGLPRLSDDELEPPAGAKRVEDIASYADDPARERAVLEEYGYRHGWERFWGHGSVLVTGVFVDQFETRAGAGAYAADLARNEARLYEGMLDEQPPDLPGGCLLLTVDEPGHGREPEGRLTGPAAFAWCAHGTFSVSVSAVATSTDAAEDEVRAVMERQLHRLPTR
jgi:hypothetical protein